MLAVSNNQIRPARYHLWSEPLEVGIRRVLSKELVSQLESLGKEVTPIQIDLEIEALHATETGKVILKGVWKTKDSEIAEQVFAIQSDLLDDGYPAAVAAHVSALSMLAESIAQSL